MGQVSYTTAGSSYLQNFDTLPATGTAGTTFTWTDNSTLPGWYAALGTTSAPATIGRISDGSINSGSVYSFGVLSDADRALGSIGSGSTGPTGGPQGIYYGMQLVNNTGVTLGSFTISYTGEEWRATGTASLNTTVQNTLSFAYSTTAASIYDTGYNSATSLDFKAPAAGSPPGYTALDAAVNGNTATYQSAVSNTVTILGGWAPGASLWVRWLDINDPGNDQGLALDNLSFSAVAHVPMHNGTTLSVGGSKTPPQVDLGRVVAGNATSSATVNLNSAGGATNYQDVSQDGSVVTPASGPVAASGTTPVSVKIGAGAVPTSTVGTDVSTHALIQNTGEDNDTNVDVNLKVHVVANRFVDNFDENTFTGGSSAPVDFGKMLVGSTKTITGVTITTVNSGVPSLDSTSLTTVTLPADSVSGFAGGSTSGYATTTLSAGTNGAVTFDDGGDYDTRDVTLTVIQSGIVTVNSTGGQRSPGYLSIPLIQNDTAVGASGDARVYVSGDFYAPALVTGDATAVAPGGTITLTNNLPPTSDSTSGKRLGAQVTSTSIDQSGWSVSGISAGTTIGGSRAGYTANSVTNPPMISTITGSVSFDPTGKLNGTYGATLTIGLQNDQTQGVYGVTANDLASTTEPLSATVSSNPSVQVGAYSLNGGTLSAPATNLTGSFSQTGGASTFASLIGGGAISVSGGSMILSGSSSANLVRSLTITGTGKVDLTNSKLAIDYTGGTPANAIRLALLAGSANGWTGMTGLTSSDAAANTAASYAIGYAEASQVLGAAGGTWNGVTVDGTALLLKETYFGDANLDGKVNADDFALADKGMATNLATGSARWTDGDFNYDGSVTSADFLLMDTAFAQHGGALSPEFLAGREAEFGEAYVNSLIAAVPEPTSLGLVGIMGAGLLARRRRVAR